jgi:FkbM family methyltransferase
MRKVQAKHKNLNKGKETILYTSISKQEFQNQYTEIFDIEHYKLGRRKKNATYLDLGANIGLSCLYFKDWAKKIYAVEPSKDNFEALLKNTKQYKNIECFNYGIGPDNRKVPLYKTVEDSTPQTFMPRNVPWSAELAYTIRIDDFFKQNNIKHIDVMKIDIESYEYVVLPHNSFANVASKIDFIIGESHFAIFRPPSVKKGESIYCEGFIELIPEMLKDYGFKTRFLKFDDGNMFRTYDFDDLQINKTKHYQVNFNTIFVAERK